MTKSKIAIVEDSPTTSFYIKKILTERGFEVSDIAATGEDALILMAKNQPDLVLMDIVLEGKMDGIETSVKMQSFTDIPVIYITSSFDEKILMKVKETPHFGYLTKPFKENDLYLAVETALYRYSMEKKVKEKEKKFRSLFENMISGFVYLKILFDSRGVIDDFEILEVNSVYEKMMNRKRQSIKGKRLTEVIPEVKKNELSWIFTDRVELRSSKTLFKDMYYRRIGKWLSVSIYSPSEGFLVLLIDDITKRKKAELALLKANRETELLLSSITSILIEVSSNDRIKHWNRVAEETFGIKSDLVMNMPLMECGLSWNWESVYEGITESIINERPVKMGDIKFTYENGNEGFLDLIVNPIMDRRKKLNGFLLSGDDVTQKRNLEMQLNQAQKLESIGLLAAGIAHEINTPMQYINDNTSFLKESFIQISDLIRINRDIICMNHSIEHEVINEIHKKLEKIDVPYLEEEVPKAIDQTLEGIKRVTSIVKSMKNFAHPGSDTKTIININSAINDTINISRNEWKYFAELITDFDENLPEVNCYLNEFNQVILNIIVNASHAIEEKYGNSSGEKGKIIITTGVKNGWVDIVIEDTGCGMPESIKTKIFDPFFTTKKAGKGSGQGLAISYDVIVQKHGGQIICDSCLEKGTSFLIRLPV